MMLDYSKQNLFADPRIVGRLIFFRGGGGGGGLSDIPWRPRLALFSHLRGPNGQTFDLALPFGKPQSVLASSPTRLPWETPPTPPPNTPIG